MEGNKRKRIYNSKQQVEAQKKYDAEHTKRITFKCHLENDKDVLEAIQAAENKQGFIKEAIRQYIKKEGAG